MKEHLCANQSYKFEDVHISNWAAEACSLLISDIKVLYFTGLVPSCTADTHKASRLFYSEGFAPRLWKQIRLRVRGLL